MSKSVRLFILSIVLIFSTALFPVSPAFAATVPAEINQSFTPIAIVSGHISALQISIYNPNANQLTNASWENDLSGVQAGLLIATPLHYTIGASCGPATLTAIGGGALSAGGTTIAISGATVPPQVGDTPGSCTVEVDVTSFTPGNLINTIPEFNTPPLYGGQGLTATTTDPSDPTHTPVTIHNTTPASATLNVIGVQAPSLSKSFAPNTIAVGQTSTLTIRLTNNDTKNSITQTTLTDLLPTAGNGDVVVANPVTTTLNGCGTSPEPIPTLTDQSGNPLSGGVSTSIKLNNATVHKSSTCVITILVTSLKQGSYTNTIPAGPASSNPGAIQTLEGVTNASPASDILNVQSFNLTKSFATSPIAAGDSTQMSITIQNIASLPYTGASLDDQLPAGLQFDNTVLPAISCAGGSATFAIATTTNTDDTLQMTNGTLPANTTCTITATVKALMSAAEKTYTNTIPIGALHTTQGASNTAPATANLDVKSLFITKAFLPTTFAAGQTSTLTITAHNPSATAFTGASLSDSLPTSPNSNLEFTGTPTTDCNFFHISSPLGVSFSGSPTREVDLAGGYIAGGTLGSPGTCTITATVTANANAPAASYTNTIPANNLTTTEGGTNVSPATANVSITSITPTVTKAFGGNIQAGGTQSLTITITNPAGGPAMTNVGLVDDLSTTLTGLSFTSVTSNSCSGTGTAGSATGLGTQVITLSGYALDPGLSTCTVVVVVTMPLNTNSGTYTNTIQQSSFTNNEGRGIAGNVTGQITVRAVDLVKGFYDSTNTSTVANFQAGGTITLRITLQNYTTTDLTVNTFTDNLGSPTNSQLTVNGVGSTTCSGGAVTVDITNKIITLTGGTIPHGNPGTCTITVPVTGTLVGGPYTNTIPAGNLTTVAGPSNPVDRTASISIYTLGAGMTATKAFSPGQIGPNGTSTLTLTFNAPPDTALSNFSVTDDLPNTALDTTTTPATSVSAVNHLSYGTVSQNTCGGTVALNTVAPYTTPNKNVLQLTGGAIGIGGSCNIRVTVTSDMGSGGGIQYTNTINPGDITNGQGRNIPSAVSDTLTVQTPSTLTVSKAFYPTIVNPGGLSTLKITLTNTNTSKLINVTLDDFLPDSITNGVIVATTPNESTTCEETGNPASITFPTSQTIHMSNGTIPAKVGAVNGVCTINVDVQGMSTNGTSPATHHNNIPATNVIATINGTTSTMIANGPATADLTVRNLDLEVVKGFNPQLVYGGADSVMSITLRNPNSSTALTGIHFIDSMPAVQMILVNPPNFDPSDCNPPSGSPATLTKIDNSTFEFSGGYLAPGGECTLTLDATLIVNGNRTNTIPIGAVTSFNGAYNRSPTSASLTNLAGASISKSFSPNPVASGLGSYSILTITIRNTTSLSLTQLGLVDDLPSGLQIAGGSAPAPTNACGGTLSAPAGGTVIQLSGASLTLGFSNCSMTIPVTGANPGDYTNIIPAANLTSAEHPEVREDASATLTLTPYSLGNRVWYDTNNNGVIDTGEVGVRGVTVDLYKDNGSTPGVFDSGDTLVGPTTTDTNGYYRFDNLAAGDYIVVIPHSNFSSGAAPLAGYLSSGSSITGTTVTDSIGPSPNNDVDSDDNGVSTFSGMAEDYVSSRTVTLGPGSSEPIGETDIPSPNPPGEAVDNQSNLTVDFGFYRLQLGNLVFADLNANGTYNSGIDSPIPGATVELFASNGTTEINVGPDGILGTADDASGGVTTSAGGTYQFSGMPAGDYIVKVLPTGYPSTVDTASAADTANPNNNIDNNDNGVGTGSGTASSNVVTLTPGAAGAAANNVITNSTGTTYNPTVDFGYLTSLGKKIVSTSAPSTTGSDVTIGEIITYEVDMTIPPLASMPNTVLVDTPDAGLAFVDCVSVTMPAGVSSSTYTSGPCNTKDGTTPGTSNPLITNSGGTIAFDFGTITNANGSAQLMQVQYSLIVLDTLANQNGVTRTNHVSWTFGTAPATTTYTTNAPPVKIVEPKLTVTKNANPTTVSAPSIVTYTLDIAHSSESQAGAFDVVLNDHIPDGLTYDPASLNVTGTATLTSSSFDPATNTLQLRWNSFPLNDTAHVTFQAAYLGPGSATNTATVEWMSLAIDPRITPPLSTYDTTDSTVRYFNTGSGNGDSYGAAASATIGPPGQGGRRGGGIGFAGIEPGMLPGTGFAPGQITNIPAQPSSQAYADLGNLWLEIPRLKVRMPIVGIPLKKDGEWDLTWLGDQAGYLNGTAYPTHAGNSVLTAHVYMANGQPGPFVNLASLQWGDQIIVHLDGQKYIYQVAENKMVLPQDISAIKHETLPWLTLLTCKDYNASTNTYAHRVLVGAVLVKIQPDTNPNPNPTGK